MRRAWRRGMLVPAIAAAVLVGGLLLMIDPWSLGSRGLSSEPTATPEAIPMAEALPLPVPTEQWAPPPPTPTPTPTPTPEPTVDPRIFRGAHLTCTSGGEALIDGDVSEYTADMRASVQHPGQEAPQKTVYPEGADTIAYYSGNVQFGSFLSAQAEMAVGIFAHSYIGSGLGSAAFDALPELQLEDSCVITTPTETLRYEVVAAPVYPAKGTLNAYLKEHDDVAGRLFLISCNREGALAPSGHAIENIVLTLQLIEDPTPAQFAPNVDEFADERPHPALASRPS